MSLQTDLRGLQQAVDDACAKIDELRAKCDRLRASNEELVGALTDIEPALILLAEANNVPDECTPDGPCGSSACAQVGCLIYIRDMTRAALARHEAGKEKGDGK